MFTTSIHTHVRSLFDAYIEPYTLCEKIKELGGTGICVTDHGVLSSIEDYRRVFSEKGLKFVPGVELYVDGGLLGRQHLIMLAKNDAGYKCISKVVTAANKTLDNKKYPVISKNTLFNICKQYDNDIIVTSACMQGVIASVIFQNETINEKIAPIKKKQEKYLAPASVEFTAADEDVKKCEADLEAKIINRDSLKICAEQKFIAREKAVEKAMKTANKDAEVLKETLEADKKAALIAQKELPEAKNAVNMARKNLSAANSRLKEVKESIDNWLQCEEGICYLKSKIKSNDTIYIEAMNIAKEYQSHFKNFYIELQYHGIEAEAVCFPIEARIAKELNIPVVASNDVHILTNSKEELLKRQVMRSLRFQKWEETQPGDEELYLKTDEELKESLIQILDEDVVDEAIANIKVIFDSCNVEFKSENHYPKFPCEGDINDAFDEEIKKGVKWRFPAGMDAEHKKRLDHEVNTIKSMGYANYHLVDKDFLEYARLLGYVPTNLISEAPLDKKELRSWIKENGWKNKAMVTGPGRGSAVGSLACYVLGITAVDPMDYDLLFERFLNPDRVSMPDIDSDFANSIRGKVIEYVQHVYGHNAVCGIMTINAQAPKGALRIAAKYYGLSKYGEAMTALGDSIARLVSKEVGINFASTVDNRGKLDKNSDMTLSEFLIKNFNKNADALNIIKWAQIIEGIPTSYGAHAAGIVISDNDDISDYTPLRMNTELGMMTTQCDMVQTEENGLLKFDFLGLKTLDIISSTLRLIENNTGLIIDPLKIDFKDERVFKEIFSAGKTKSVFQFESDGMRNMLKRFKPTCFEDLIILVSMFRPGPLQFLNDVIDVKNGKKAMMFLCPQLEPILGKTYGAMVYQEQVMAICQELAGFTLAHSDNVRRFMSKKKHDKLAHEREAFVDGCSKNGISEDISNQIFDQMMDFASYAFNKSHATAYALNAYITAWLKLYYPAEFFASALNWADNKKMAGLISEAKNMGVEICAPDINKSDTIFSASDGKILFGLSNIKGISSHAQAIISERETNGIYLSLKDFCMRCIPNITVMTNLIKSGAFDAFNDNRAAMLLMVSDLKDILSKLKEKESFIRSATFCLPDIEKMTAAEIVEHQLSVGLKAEITEPTTVDKLSKRISNAKETYLSYKSAFESVSIKKIHEDKVARMQDERELLGNYITDNPINMYPSAAEVHSHTITDGIDNSENSILGIAIDIEIKSRKSDGAKMAFFTLVDRDNEIPCCMFTKVYASCGNLLAEGNAYIVNGKVSVNDSDDDEDTLQYIVSNVSPVSEKKSSFLIEISSYAVFHTRYEESLRNEYETPDGHKLYFYDKAMDEIREATYLVSDDIRVFDSCQEVFI